MIFLSASIPDPRRDEKYYDTADVIAIRDAVRALATVVIPKAKLVWGGHPAITPLIYYIMNAMGMDQSHVVLYQSDFRREDFPRENRSFEQIVVTPAFETEEESILNMRVRMLADNKFSAGIFIGGMEGVELEYSLFRQLQPDAKAFPIASTGAAAKIIYEREYFQNNEMLLSEYAYMSLFRNLLKEIIEF